MKSKPENLRKKRKVYETFSLASFKKQGLLPLLAYDTGVHIGDGCLGEYKDKRQGKKPRLQYTGDLVNELDYYETVLAKIFKELYNFQVTIIHHTYDNTCLIRTRTKSIC